MKKPLIWIVEDDRDITDLVTAYLRREGFDLEVFHKGEAMVERLGDTLPSLFLVDLSLPDSDGITLTRKIRATTNHPILLVTGRGGLEDRPDGWDGKELVRLRRLEQEGGTLAVRDVGHGVEHHGVAQVALKPLLRWRGVLEP